MNKTKEILNRAKTNRPNGIYLLSALDAIDLIRACEEENREIYGVDAFILTDGTTQPVSEDSIDYSINPFKSYRNWNKAITFIEQIKSKGYHFEVVYEQ